jgi:hypothetical protein
MATTLQLYLDEVEKNNSLTIKLAAAEVKAKTYQDAFDRSRRDLQAAGNAQKVCSLLSAALPSTPMSSKMEPAGSDQQ